MLHANQIIQKLSKRTALCKCAQCGAEYVCSVPDARRSRLGHICNSCKSCISSLTQFTQQDLLKVFEYNENTGELTHKWDTHHSHKGDVVGFMYKHGYRGVCIGRKQYLLHRVIWFMQTGKWPEQIDHIDHDKSNNRWNNLREVTNRDNALNCSKASNNTSGVQGIRILPSGKFCAYIMVHRKQISLGSYEKLEDAIAARKAAELQHGFHVNHGN